MAVYFDSSVFLEVFHKRTKRGSEIKGLLRELQKENVRLYTSIISVQEISVLSFKRGSVAADLHSRLEEFARIYGINKDIALTAAKFEAQIKDGMSAKELTDEQRVGENRRRKWDCFHIATALYKGCTAIYSEDQGLLDRGKQLGIRGMKFLKPEPITGTLFKTALPD